LMKRSFPVTKVPPSGMDVVRIVGTDGWTLRKERTVTGLPNLIVIGIVSLVWPAIMPPEMIRELVFSAETECWMSPLERFVILVSPFTVAVLIVLDVKLVGPLILSEIAFCVEIVYSMKARFAILVWSPVNLTAPVVLRIMCLHPQVVLVVETVSSTLEKNATLSTQVVPLTALDVALAGSLLVTVSDHVVLVETVFWTLESDAILTKTVLTARTAEHLTHGPPEEFAYFAETVFWMLERLVIPHNPDVPVIVNFARVVGSLLWIVFLILPVFASLSHVPTLLWQREKRSAVVLKQRV